MSSVNVERADDVTVIFAEGLFTGGEETEELRLVMQEALQQPGQRKILLNLSGTQLMLSLAVGILMTTHVRAKERGILFYVCGVRPSLHKVLETIMVKPLALRHFDDCAEALEALKKL
jgi:anti-anti-sigma factor